MHLLVSELYRFQNARSNDKKKISYVCVKCNCFYTVFHYTGVQSNNVSTLKRIKSYFFVVSLSGQGNHLAVDNKRVTTTAAGIGDTV